MIETKTNVLGVGNNPAKAIHRSMPKKINEVLDVMVIA